jgi:hypothetical protein
MKLTKWTKLAGADGFSSAAKMKWRVLSNFMGAINPPSKPAKPAEKATPSTLLAILRETYVGL